jgi:hypothetical protein
MNNHDLSTADRRTHARIVGVALVACIAVIGATKSAQQKPSETNARVEARVHKISAEKLVVWTGADRVIR